MDLYNRWFLLDASRKQYRKTYKAAGGFQFRAFLQNISDIEGKATRKALNGLKMILCMVYEEIRLITSKGRQTGE